MQIFNRCTVVQTMTNACSKLIPKELVMLMPPLEFGWDLTLYMTMAPFGAFVLVILLPKQKLIVDPGVSCRTPDVTLAVH